MQTVEQFPWEVIATLNFVIEKLDKMAQSLKLVQVKSDADDNVEEFLEGDPTEWPYLLSHLEELKLGKFKNLALNSGTTAGRITRNKSDLGHEKDQITMYNRLTSLCKYQSKHIAIRTVDNQEHPVPKVISSMENCFDLQKMITAIRNEDDDITSYGVESLEKVLKTASYSDEEADQVKSEYLLFKERLLDLLFNKKVQMHIW